MIEWKHKLSLAICLFASAFLLCQTATGAGNDLDQTTGTYAGTIAFVDKKERVLEVKNELSSMRFRVDKDARIDAREKGTVELGDLRVGDKVRVDYTKQKGVFITHRIGLNDVPYPETEVF